jgi:TusA-related sulfurtransferase
VLESQKAGRRQDRLHDPARRQRRRDADPHVTLDMRGVSCPGPIVQARKLLDGMKAGEVLQLVSDCPGSADDIASWAKAGAAELLFSHETGRGIHEFFLRRG